MTLRRDLLRQRLEDRGIMSPRDERARVGQEVANLESRIRSTGHEPPARGGLRQNPLLTLLDYVSRPGYATFNALREYSNPEVGMTPGVVDPGAAFMRGLRGEERTMGRDIMGDYGLSRDPMFNLNMGKFNFSPSPAGVAGFVADVLNPLDPINWITFGGGQIPLHMLKGAKFGPKIVDKAFGKGSSEYFAEKLGEEFIENLAAPTVGRLAEKITDRAQKLGLREGVNPEEISRRLLVGMESAGTRAGTRLLPESRKTLEARLQYPISNKPIASLTIPGSEKFRGLLSHLGQKGMDTDIGQALGKAFSTSFVPKTVPRSVWTKIMTKDAPPGSKIMELPGSGPRGEPGAGVGLGDLADTPGGVRPDLEELVQKSGKESYSDLIRGLHRMTETSRAQEQRFMENVEGVFRGLNKEERKLVLRAAADPSIKVEGKVGAALGSFKQWRQDIVDAYKNLGVTFTPMEAYVPFVSTGKILSKDEAALLKAAFGTSVRQVGENDLVSMLGNIDQHLRKRTTKAVSPSEVNRVLGRKWLTEDAAIAMSRRGIKAIRGQEAATFLQGMMKKYGLTVENLEELKHLPGGYVLVRPRVESSGRIVLEPTAGTETGTLALPQEFANAYNNYTDMLFNTSSSSAVGRFYDDLNQVYKTIAYMWNPGHIPRDFVSNVYNLWLADVRGPAPWTKAMGAMMHPKDSHFKFQHWEGTGEDLINLSRDLGLLDSSAVLAEFMQAGGDWAFRFGGKYTEAMRASTRAVDNYSRMAGMIDRLGKGDTPEQAVAVVKKYLFDYFELTNFEKRWMKRVIPFYTWMRKNIPLQVEALMKKPGKYAATYRATAAMGEYPEEGEAPEFLRERGGFKLPGEEGGQYIIPNISYQDIGQLPTDMRSIREMTAMLNPLLRAPLEILSNTALFSGQPLERYEGERQELPFAQLLENLFDIDIPGVPKRTWGYALDQLPPLRNIATIANPEHPRQMARLASVLGGPQVYPAEWAEGAVTYEQRDKMRAFIRLLQDLGVEVPTTQELEGGSKKGKSRSRREILAQKMRGR